MTSFSIIVATDEDFGIGKSNKLAWHIPSELIHFQETTRQSTVIMGRKTYDSLPIAVKPLKSRENIVISRNTNLQLPKTVKVVHSLDDALKHSTLNKIFVIGGAQIYKQALAHKNCTQVIRTKVLGTYNCDTFFDKISLNQYFILDKSSKIFTDGQFQYVIEYYTRKVSK